MTRLAGSRLGPYETLDRIGHGEQLSAANPRGSRVATGGAALTEGGER